MSDLLNSHNSNHSNNNFNDTTFSSESFLGKKKDATMYDPEKADSDDNEIKSKILF